MSGGDRPRSRGAVRLAWGLVVVSVVFAVILRVDLIDRKTQMDHDEGISYLAATGHQVEYEQALRGPGALTNRWVPASEWRRLLRRERFGVFATINRDLAATDIHPPLYFWLLHLWLWIADSSVTSGARLNLIFAALTGMALFGLARRALRSDGQAAVVVVIWSLSPAAAAVSSVARPYDLLATLTVLLTWQALRYVDPTARAGVRESVLVGVTAAAGALTHHHFAIVATGTALMVAALTWRRAPRRPWPFVLSLGAGYAVLLVVMGEGVLAKVFRQQEQSRAFPSTGLAERMAVVVTTFRQAWDPTDSLVRAADKLTAGKLPVRIAVAVAALSVAAAVMLDAGLRRQRSVVASWYHESRGGPLAVLFLALWTTSVVVALYLSAASAGHAMGARYLAMSWPLLAFLPVTTLRVVPRGAAPLVLAYGLLLLLPADLETLWSARPARPAAAVFGPGRQVVLDNPARGILPRAVDLMADEARVYAAWQVDLLRSPEPWLSPLHSGDAVISVALHQAGPYRLNDLLARITARHPVEALRSPVRPPGLTYILGGAPIWGPRRRAPHRLRATPS
jgi:Dolichyl-phosphate-mannose-protein mannosyltransferase